MMKTTNRVPRAIRPAFARHVGGAVTTASESLAERPRSRICGVLTPGQRTLGAQRIIHQVASPISVSKGAELLQSFLGKVRNSQVIRVIVG